MMGLKTPVLCSVLLAVGAFLAPLEAWAQVQEVAHAAADMAADAHISAPSHGGGLPQFNPALWPSQIFWLTIFFIVLYRVFSSVILPEISQTLDTRRAYIDQLLSEAETANFEAQKLEYDLQMAQKNSAQIAADSLKDAQTEAQQKLQAALNSFRARTETEVEATGVRLRNLTLKAKGEIDSAMADITVAIVEKITGLPAQREQIYHVVNGLDRENNKAA
ncbi:MAG: hypothetical protein JNK24_04950 [Alphaproteobacteria bacterium]|nr:hypothetical protein [Alphaproteobacteria bacterium]